MILDNELFLNKLCHNKTVNKLINFLAVWILVFALPMQGYAAATMMSCEKSHSHEALSLVNSHNHSLQSGHDEASNNEVTHEDATDNHAAHHSSSSKHTCSHCCTCTACCASTAIVASSLNLPVQFDNSKANLVYSAPKFTSFVSAGLERPPRSILV